MNENPIVSPKLYMQSFTSVFRSVVVTYVTQAQSILQKLDSI